MKMEKIYPNADLKLVSSVILYHGENLTPATNGDNYILYWDKELTKPVSGTDLAELFVSARILMSDDGVYGSCPEDYYVATACWGPYPNDDPADPTCYLQFANWNASFNSAEYVPPVPEETE